MGSLPRVYPFLDWIYRLGHSQRITDGLKTISRTLQHALAPVLRGKITAFPSKPTYTNPVGIRS